MVAILCNASYAECNQLVSDYDPDPPFHAGSLNTAPPDVRDAMVNLLVGSLSMLTHSQRNTRRENQTASAQRNHRGTGNSNRNVERFQQVNLEQSKNDSS